VQVSSRDPRRAAPHLAYELGVFRKIFGAVSPDGAIDVVLLEAFLLHARNLIEFFFDGAPSGNILPKDFGAPAARDKDSDMQTLREEINQLVSHLTWQRVTVHELRPQDWSYSRLKRVHDAIRLKAKVFFGAIGEERHWFTAEAFPEEYKHWASSD
jgi:hypothetical protein